MHVANQSLIILHNLPYSLKSSFQTSICEKAEEELQDLTKAVRKDLEEHHGETTGGQGGGGGGKKTLSTEEIGTLAKKATVHLCGSMQGPHLVGGKDSYISVEKIIKVLWYSIDTWGKRLRSAERLVPHFTVSPPGALGPLGPQVSLNAASRNTHRHCEPP